MAPPRTLYYGVDAPADVTRLHNALRGHGALPAACGEEVAAHTFGFATASAVRSWQHQAGLAADGVVGPATWSSLIDARSVVVTDVPQPGRAVPDYAAATPLMASALSLAYVDWQARVAETPPGSNRGKRVDEYLVGWRGDGVDYLEYQRPEPGQASYQGWRGAPWCGRAARYWCEAAAAGLRLPPPFDSWESDLASATKWLAAGERMGRIELTPAVGYAAILTEPTTHVTLIARLDARKGVGTLEGNEGNAVAWRWRPAVAFHAFVRIG